MKKVLILAVAATLVCGAAEHRADIKKQEAKSRIIYGKILQIEKAMGYDYLKVDRNGTVKWVAIASAPVQKGDTIGFDERTVMKDFKSKTLGKTFDEIIFANEVYLKQKKTPQIKSLKAALDIAHHGETVEKAPLKAFYTVEEIHRYRKSLAGKTVSVKARVHKVSRQIMKRDWVHLQDGTGDAKALTDDLVFTAKEAAVNAGESVVAKAKITVDKDFGYGYFYRVLGEEARFIKE